MKYWTFSMLTYLFQSRGPFRCSFYSVNSLCLRIGVMKFSDYTRVQREILIRAESFFLTDGLARLWGSEALCLWGAGHPAETVTVCWPASIITIVVIMTIQRQSHEKYKIQRQIQNTKSWQIQRKAEQPAETVTVCWPAAIITIVATNKKCKDKVMKNTKYKDRYKIQSTDKYTEKERELSSQMRWWQSVHLLLSSPSLL